MFPNIRNYAQIVNSTTLCSEIREDLFYFKKFQTQYPEKFSFIKYEELTENPVQVGKELFERINVTFSNNVKIFLQTHTKVIPEIRFFLKLQKFLEMSLTSQLYMNSIALMTFINHRIRVRMY